MKHSKWIAAVAAAGGLFAMSSGAYAIAPAIALGVGALAGAAAGSSAAQAHEPPVAVVPAPAPTVAVVPADNSTVVMGGPSTTIVQEAAPGSGYQWRHGHYEVHNGVRTWVAGQWIPNTAPIYEGN